LEVVTHHLHGLKRIDHGRGGRELGITWPEGREKMGGKERHFRWYYWGGMKGNEKKGGSNKETNTRSTCEKGGLHARKRKNPRGGSVQFEKGDELKKKK